MIATTVDQARLHTGLIHPRAHTLMHLPIRYAIK
jgi:hypothetical protein